MPKPASHIDWTDGAAAKVTEPTVGKKLLGWILDERPSFKFMNFLFFRVDEWLKYFEGVTDGLIALQSTFDVVVGVGGTHATLADAIADGGLGANVRVLVIDPFSITSTIVLSKNGWYIEFKPQAIYAQSGATTPGIRITAEGVSLLGGRFIDFDNGSDVAIELAATAKNCLIHRNRFFNVDSDIVEIAGAANNTLSDNINEV